MRVNVLCLVLLLSLLSSNVALVTASSWSEVTRFTGWGDYTTEYFTCNHVDWRINWNYTPSANDSTLANFFCYVFPKNQDYSIASIVRTGNTTTNGTVYVYLRQGEFYLKINTIQIDSYTLVIEQDLESIPEFSPMLLLSLFTIGMTVAMIARMKRHNHSILNRQTRST